MEKGSANSIRAGFSGRRGFERAISAILAAWVLSLAFDFLLHAGLLAKLYADPGPFLLPPEDALRRIPLGYLSFLILTAGLYWLLVRLDIRGTYPGIRYGLGVGGVVWGAFAIGLYSISTAPTGLLTGWWSGQTIELGLAGAVLGSVFDGQSLPRIWLVVVLATIICIVVTVGLQTLGLAPQMAPVGGQG